MPRLPAEIEVTSSVRIPSAEIDLAYAGSSGPGGQHVNRTATKVQLRWNVRRSAALDERDRAWLEVRLARRLTTEGELLVTSERHREQSRNVEDALERFVEIVRTALRRPKRRKKTRPTAASRERRLAEKRRRGEQKRLRRPPPSPA